MEEIRYPFTISCPPDLSSVLSSLHQALYCVSHHKTCTWLTVINSLMNRSRVTEDSYLNLPVPSQEIAVSVVILLAIAITVGTVGNFGVCAILARRVKKKRPPIRSTSVTRKPLLKWSSFFSNISARDLRNGGGELFSRDW